MDIEIQEQVILYTGAAGLIGSAACNRLAQEGASLCLIDPDASSLEILLKQIFAQNKNAKCIAISDLDTLNPDSVDSMIERVEKEFGPITCLINSAYPRTQDWHLRFEKIPLNSWRQNIDDHLNGYFLMSQRVALKMIPRRKGNIINFGSIYGLVGPDFSVYEGLGDMTMPAAYAAIKGGVTSLTRYLAAYLGPYSIRCNAICPGGVKNNQAPSFIESYEKKTPMKRMASVDDVVGPLLFLVSNLSQYVTGVSLPVDGGWTAI